MDWKKDYKLSDLFHRQDHAEPGEVQAAPAEERLWKKEIKLSSLFRRQKKERQRAIPPVGETGASDAVARSPLDDVSIWKKELKLSSLFRRKKSTKPRSGPLALPRAGDTVPEAPTADEPQVSASADPVAPAAEPAEQGEVAVEAESAPEPVSAATEPEPAPTQVAETPPGAPNAPPQADASEAPAQQIPAAKAAAEPERAVPAPAPEAAPEPEAEESPVGPEIVVAPAPKVPWYKKELGGGKKPEQAPAAEASPRSEPAADAGPKRREKQKQPKAESAPQRKPAKTGDLSRVPLMKALNLLPKDVQLAKRSQVRPVFIQAAAVFAAVLVAGGVGLLYKSQQSTLSDKQGALEDVSAQVAELQAEVQQAESGHVNGSSLAGEALKRATALSSALDARVNWDRLLRELSLTLPSGVWFESMAGSGAPIAAAPAGTTGPPTAVASASGVTITGYAMDQEGVARLLARLAVIPEFTTVQLQSATQVTVGTTPVIQFNVAGQLKPQG